MSGHVCIETGTPSRQELAMYLDGPDAEASADGRLEAASGDGRLAGTVIDWPVISGAEAWLAVAADARDHEDHEIDAMAAAALPDELYPLGSRCWVASERVLAALEAAEVRAFRAAAIELVHERTARRWPAYFYVRFTARREGRALAPVGAFYDLDRSVLLFDDRAARALGELGIAGLTFRAARPGPGLPLP